MGVYTYERGAGLWPEASPVRLADMADIHGTCHETFETVRAAFEKNFTEGDLGASCAVTQAL